MALALTLREGHDFYIGDRRFVVSDVSTPLDFVVSSMGESFRLDSEEWLSVGDGVDLAYGIPRKQDGKVVRLMVRAPGLKVLRGELYRASSLSPGPTPTPTPKNATQGHLKACGVCHGKGFLRQEVACKACGGFGCHECKNTGYVWDTFKCPECGATDCNN